MENNTRNPPAPSKKDLIDVLEKTGTIKKGEKWDNLTTDQLDHLIGISERPIVEPTEEEKAAAKEQYLDSLGNKDELMAAEIVKRRTSDQNLKQFKAQISKQLEAFASLVK
jgi:hypothetical protein